MTTIYSRVTGQAVVIKRIPHRKLFVRAYTFPEKIGSIYTPAALEETKAYARDKSQTLWEVVAWGPGAQEWAREHVGILFEVDDIITTNRRFAIDTGCMDANGEPLYAIDCESHIIRSVTKWKDDEVDDAVRDGIECGEEVVSEA